MIGTGAAGVIVGGVTGFMAISKKSTLQDSPSCMGTTSCFPDQRGNVDSYNSLRIVSGAGLIAGSVLGAAGAVIVLTAPKASTPDTARAGLWLRASADQVTLLGKF
jgi:hypothetical protein